MTGSELSLRQVNQELLNLLAYRSDPAAYGDCEPLTPEALAEVDAQIAETVNAMVKKVDGVAAVLLHFADQGAAIQAEMARLKAMATRIEADDARLREIVKSVMETLPAPARGKVKRLAGMTSKLELWPNGSVEPLTISEPRMVPREMCRDIGWIRSDVWQAMTEDVPWLRPEDYQFTSAPWPQAIREELEKPCEACEGRGGFDIETESGTVKERCVTCGGSGRRGVPGCSLATRGAHVRVT